MRTTFARLAASLVACLTINALSATAARAVPAFAAQTGQPCQMCHVGGFGPQLTAYGRSFKIGGYTQRATPFSVPLSAMAVASYVKTAKDQEPPPHYRPNDNTTFDEIAVFLAGGLGQHLGGFVEGTWDGVARAFTWDNLDLRAVTRGKVGGLDVVAGVTLNNAPGITDPWNTLPAWGFPYTGSDLAPAPGAAPLFDGALAQTVLGATGYVWINNHLYLEAGAYGSPAASTVRHLGADPSDPGDIEGLAPYGRIAWQTSLAGGTAEVGAFALRANLHPGLDRETGLTDRYADAGIDASYQRQLGEGVFSLNGRYIHESRKLEATCALAEADAACIGGDLDDVRGDISYYWRGRIGLTVQAFNTTGAANPVLYADNRTLRPDSTGVSLQVDGTPLGGLRQPARRLNLRVGLQYTLFTRFNGAGSNFDGAGAHASDNNTLRLFTWFAF